MQSKLQIQSIAQLYEKILFNSEIIGNGSTFRIVMNYKRNIVL